MRERVLRQTLVANGQGNPPRASMQIRHHREAASI